MRHWFFLTWLALWAFPVFAGQPTINGPTEAAVGEAVTFEVTGLPILDMAKPLGEQLEWFGHATPYVFPSTIGEPLRSRLYFEPVTPTTDVVDEVQAVLTGSTDDPTLIQQLQAAVDEIASRQPAAEINFVCMWELKGKFSEPGRATVVVDWNLEPMGLAAHELTVGGTPPPPPPPPGELFVVVIVEEQTKTEDLTPQQAFVLTSQRVADLVGRKNFQVRDPDVEGPGAVEFAPYVQRAKAIGLPAFFVVAEDGTVLYEGPVPKDVDAAVGLIQSFAKEADR